MEYIDTDKVLNDLGGEIIFKVNYDWQDGQINIEFCSGKKIKIWQDNDFFGPIISVVEIK